VASKQKSAWRRVAKYALRELRGSGSIALPGGSRKLSLGSRHCRVQPDYEILYSLARGRQCVFDVGAKVGMTAMTLAAAADQGVVYAFEAAESSCLVLRRNLVRNGLDARVHVVNAVLGAVSGQSFEYHWNLVSGRSGIVMAPPDGATPIQKVTTSLDDFADHAGLRPDLVKIDVEGGELGVLEGMSRILSDARPDIVLELHAWPGTSAASHAEQILKCLGPPDYQMRWLSRDRIVESASDLDDLPESTKAVASRARFLLSPRGRPAPDALGKLELGAIDPG